MTAKQIAKAHLEFYGLKSYPYNGLQTKGLILLTTDKETPITHNLGKHISFYCDKCGEPISSIYESDVAKEKCGIYSHIRFCHNCGNPFDFGEYYHK